MATIREKRPGVWEVRAFTGRDERGRPTQVSQTVHGTKRDAQRAAAEMTLRPSKSGGRTVAALLDLWLEQNGPVWAPSSARDQVSRAALVKADPIAQLSVARLSVADIDRWHARLRRAGVGEGPIRNQHQALRAALTQAMRWGWVMTTVAGLGRRKTVPRGSLSPDQVRRVLAEAVAHDPAAGLALRLAPRPRHRRPGGRRNAGRRRRRRRQLMPKRRWRYYRTPAGAAPAREFIDALPPCRSDSQQRSAGRNARLP